MIAARTSKNWQDFAKLPVTEFGSSFSHKAASKRVGRYVLVGQAQAAMDDIDNPDEYRFLENKWSMGPFYAWDSNFDSLTKATQKRKNQESI